MVFSTEVLDALHVPSSSEALILLIFSFMSFGGSIESQRTSIEFFPDEDPKQIIVYIQYPEGTDISKTNKIAKEIDSPGKQIIYTTEEDFISQPIIDLQVQKGTHFGPF